MEPPNKPPRACAPRIYPTRTGEITARRPGNTISRRDAAVEMSTHRSYCGSAVPSMRPGISRNWRRTSSIIFSAARPTAWMERALKKKGSMPPRKRPTMTRGSLRSMTLRFTAVA
jgi:hypothetical protein